MGKIDNRIRELGYTLPAAAKPVANYVTAVEVKGAGLVYTSGHVPVRADGTRITGKLGRDLTVEQGYEAAKVTALNLLGSLKAAIGDLDRVKRIVKVLAMVNCMPEFGDQPAVANGCSDLLVKVFGEPGKHARSAVGMAALPGNVCIEIEMVVEVTG